EQKFTNAIFLVLANKMDLENAMPVSKINQELDLQNTKKTFNIFPSNAKKMTGVKEGIEWLASELKKRDY
ncbi:MAG: ADP-ribosylation factor, partial [Paramarteilia canceri]